MHYFICIFVYLYIYIYTHTQIYIYICIRVNWGIEQLSYLPTEAVSFQWPYFRGWFICFYGTVLIFCRTFFLEKQNLHLKYTLKLFIHIRVHYSFPKRISKFSKTWTFLIFILTFGQKCMNGYFEKFHLLLLYKLFFKKILVTVFVLVLECLPCQHYPSLFTYLDSRFAKHFNHIIHLIDMNINFFIHISTCIVLLSSYKSWPTCTPSHPTVGRLQWKD